MPANNSTIQLVRKGQAIIKQQVQLIRQPLAFLCQEIAYS
jgi:hypothetical protein